MSRATLAEATAQTLNKYRPPTSLVSQKLSSLEERFPLHLHPPQNRASLSPPRTPVSFILIIATIPIELALQLGYRMPCSQNRNRLPVLGLFVRRHLT